MRIFFKLWYQLILEHVKIRMSPYRFFPIEKWPTKLPLENLWMLNDLSRVFWTPYSNIMFTDFANDIITSSLKAVLSPKSYFPAFPACLHWRQCKVIIIFSECFHKCQSVSLEFQTFVKNIPLCWFEQCSLSELTSGDCVRRILFFHRQSLYANV